MIGGLFRATGWPKWLALSALAGATATLSLVYDGASDRAVGAVGAQPSVDTQPDPNSILDGRSPGEREAGALFQTKPLANLMDASSPPASNLLEPSPLPTLDDAPRAFSAIVPPEQAPAVGAPTGLAPTVLPPGPSGPGSVAPFMPVLLPSIPPPILLPQDITPPNEPPVVGPPPVPEPATWMTMLVGFLVSGCVIRRSAKRSGAGPVTGSSSRKRIATDRTEQ